MCYYEKYINPFTDFGFKKIFGDEYVEIPKLKKTKEELSNHLEWWLYTFQNLNQLQEIPKRLKGDIIERVFDKAEFINLPKEEQEKYHKNLKIYRDLINSMIRLMLRVD